ncbi:tetratricopeptide repeat protein [Azohydromonas caseinilytica]|uniref:Tetratricopeptide repeat protein n=1 Tax=Azohydromonas caseinilytica TaxID=2728836 RepID=A0A848FFW4_9BURK|nr:tetratricopeptide repeat protein [Azohydromonas caseinilytica]NML16781.1 tetratricopeptide repeat protein [Azohydromonas caseinilytica]
MQLLTEAKRLHRCAAGGWPVMIREQRLLCRWVMGLLLTSLAALPAWARSWQVTSIERSGVPVSKVKVDFVAPGDSKQVTALLLPRSTLPEGATLGVPEGVTLVLESSNGQRVRNQKAPARLVLLKTGPEGESYKVLAGRWLFKVFNRLDFFNVQADTVHAQTQGTEFLAELNPGAAEARYLVTQGSLLVRHPGLVQVVRDDGTLGDTEIQITTRLVAGDPEGRFALTPVDYLARFGSYAEAQTFFEARHDAAVRDGDSAGAFNMLMALGDVQLSLARAEDARVTFERAAASQEAAPPRGDEAYWRAVLQGRLGRAALLANRFDDAVRHFSASIQQHRALPSREGEHSVEEEGTNLARAYQASGLYGCATRMAQATLEQLRQHYRGANHPAFAELNAIMGDAAFEQGKFAAALTQHEQALEILQRLRSPLRRGDGLIYHEEIVAALNAVGEDESGLGRFAQAMERHQQARKITRTIFTEPHLLDADTFSSLGWMSFRNGQGTDAIAAYDRALAVLQQLPSDALRKGRVQRRRGQALLLASRPAVAGEAFDASLRHLLTLFPSAPHPELAAAWRGLAEARRAVGDTDGSDEAARTARELETAVARREQQCPA